MIGGECHRTVTICDNFGKNCFLGSVPTELVTHPADREDIFRLADNVANLLAQTVDEIIDCTRRPLVFVAPHVVEYLVSRQDSTSFLEQVLQESELLGRERNLFALAVYCLPGSVHSAPGTARSPPPTRVRLGQ